MLMQNLLILSQTVPETSTRLTSFERGTTDYMLCGKFDTCIQIKFVFDTNSELKVWLHVQFLHARIAHVTTSLAGKK